MVTNLPDTSAIIPATPESLVPNLEQIAVNLVPPGKQLTVITDRPLFSRTRRPFIPLPLAAPPQAPVAPKVESPSSEAPQTQNLVLKGVMLNDKNARALIASEANPGGGIRVALRLNLPPEGRTRMREMRLAEAWLRRAMQGEDPNA